LANSPSSIPTITGRSNTGLLGAMRTGFMADLLFPFVERIAETVCF